MKYCRLYFTLFYCAICLVAGCSTTIHPPKHLTTIQNLKVRKQSLSSFQNFEAFGKMGFSDGKKGGNATLEWVQHASNFQIHLYGPLGSGSIQIMGQPGHVTLLQSNGKSTIANNPEALVRSELGLVIPVSGLQYWLRGIPAPGTPPKQIQIDNQQRIWEIKQQGWTISYQAYQSIDGVEFPLKLALNNGPIRLKFIFQRWHPIPPP